MSYVPKNLDKMREKLAHNLDEPTPQAGEARELIDSCRKIEEMLAADPSRLLTIDQAAERLGISQQTLRNWEKDGKVKCVRTTGGHRRYGEDQINNLRRKQVSMAEIILPMVTPQKLRALGEMLLSSFKEDEKVTLSISQSSVDNKVRILIDSEDGLTTMVKTFSVDEK